MSDIPSGDFVDVVDREGNKFYLSYLGGVYSCTCSEWKSQVGAEIKRTCIHLRAYRGDDLEQKRVNPEAVIIPASFILQSTYEENPDGKEPTSIEQLANAFEDELNLKVDRYCAPAIIYFRKYPDAYLEVESYTDPEYEFDPQDSGSPPEVFVRRVNFKQEKENRGLAELVDAIFMSLGWRLTL
ncbi:MAG: hypothetical protein K2X93_14445 [Candidatus Obscuribacterales bacterium]|nr:hypothetical protein [Candidatus Obscuribacterales bacterium]